MKKLFVTLCLFLVFFCGCRDEGGGGAGGAFEYSKTFEGDGISVAVRVDKQKVGLSETVNAELEVRMPADWEVVFPDISKRWENFDVVEEVIADDRLGGDEEIIKTRKYRLEPMSEGEIELAELSFDYVAAGSDETKILDTEAINLEVVSEFGDGQGEGQIAEIEGVKEMPDYTAYIWAGAGLGLAAAVLAFVIYRSRHRPVEEVKRRNFKAAHEIALQRLNELEDEGLVEAGKLNIFYEKVSNILRYYIEDRFRIRAPERTTEEFLNELKSDDTLAVGDKESLEKFLRHCDLVKFARHQPSDEQVRRTVDLVRDFVDRTKSDQSLVEVKQ